MSKLFEAYNKISKIFNDNLIEISVRRHEITLEFDEKIVLLDNINHFYEKSPIKEGSFIASNEDSLFLVCKLDDDILENKEKQGLFKDFISITNEIFEKVCKCPVFEFIISDKYIKMYLDKQGLTTSDLEAYETIFKEEGEGTLELHVQRPYLLFVNVNFEEV